MTAYYLGCVGEGRGLHKQSCMLSYLIKFVRHITMLANYCVYVFCVGFITMRKFVWLQKVQPAWL